MDFIKKSENINIRGEDIEVLVEYFKCNICGEEFEDQNSNYDPVAEAYRIYRELHNLIQPEEIREFRKRYGLTQNDLSNLLGWGGATLSRYENGALQDETHDKVLQLVIDPMNLLKLLKKNPHSISNSKRKLLADRLQGALHKPTIFTTFFDDITEFVEPNINNGFMRFNIQKFMNTILFLSKDGIFKTKLNKLLFYTDFKNFKENCVSITGSKYVHLPLGPVPDDYDCIFTMMHTIEKSIEVEEVDFPDGSYGERLYSLKALDFEILKPHELEVLKFVKDFFNDYTAKQIKDFSHEEKGYKETPQGEIISYKFADNLQI